MAAGRIERRVVARVVNQNRHRSLLGQVFAGNFAVDVYIAASQLDAFARQTNDAFDYDLAGVSRGSQGDHLPTPGARRAKAVWSKNNRSPPISASDPSSLPA